MIFSCNPSDGAGCFFAGNIVPRNFERIKGNLMKNSRLTIRTHLPENDSRKIQKMNIPWVVQD